VSVELLEVILIEEGCLYEVLWWAKSLFGRYMWRSRIRGKWWVVI